MVRFFFFFIIGYINLWPTYAIFSECFNGFSLAWYSTLNVMKMFGRDHKNTSEIVWENCNFSLEKTGKCEFCQDWRDGTLLPLLCPVSSLYSFSIQLNSMSCRCRQIATTAMLCGTMCDVMCVCVCVCVCYLWKQAYHIPLPPLLNN